MFAGELGINVWEPIDAGSTEPFGYQRFTPGPGAVTGRPGGRRMNATRAAAEAGTTATASGSRYLRSASM